MKSFIKGIWSRTKPEPTTRLLNHPKDLQISDMVQLSDSFGLPPRLRNQPFKVTEITTQQFEHEYTTTFNLEGQNEDIIDLTIEADAGRSTAAFSLAISRDIVEQLFDLNEFALIFDTEGPTTISPKDKLDLDYWLADSYYQNAMAERGYFYAQDYRLNGPPDHTGIGEPFDFFSLANADNSQGIEVAVYAGGETEVCLVLHRPINDVKDLWPAAATD